eukprot:CAMPEP_0184487990 /NCGR_PEP_ID=MMETSP0113_2-20130426/10465_1 /TAXON_ID=91329 /ORGANISM="Norrisiella sphaerica, Strain BC52" /LENGTH=99 /DNA_ID=CAMNT_0026870449 /DNA_START=179 /DNA_END=478 /DNA_ORIENTATION=+
MTPQTDETCSENLFDVGCSIILTEGRSPLFITLLANSNLKIRPEILRPICISSPTASPKFRHLYDFVLPPTDFYGGSSSFAFRPIWCKGWMYEEHCVAK